LPQLDELGHAGEELLGKIEQLTPRAEEIPPTVFGTSLWAPVPESAVELPHQEFAAKRDISVPA